MADGEYFSDEEHGASNWELARNGRTLDEHTRRHESREMMFDARIAIFGLAATLAIAIATLMAMHGSHARYTQKIPSEHRR